MKYRCAAVTLIISFVLLLLHPFGASAECLQNPRVEKSADLVSGYISTWDCLWFGSYPISEVTAADGSGTYALLAAQEPENGACLTLKGTSYLCLAEGSGKGLQRRFFRFEPIKWRVLSVENSTAFIMADRVLDCRAYEEDGTPADWIDCTLRDWLNGEQTQSGSFLTMGFLGAAFSSEERAAIQPTAVSCDSGGNTLDRVYLLSKPESQNPAYGFSEHSSRQDEARQAGLTPYAKAAEGALNGWWLRSSCASAKIVYHASAKGDTGYGKDDYSFAYGLRPVLKLDLTSGVWSPAGTVCSDGSEDEIPAPLPEKQTVTGDINGDGSVDLQDVAALYRLLTAGKGHADDSCDINGDGLVSLRDAAALFKAVSHLPEPAEGK